MKKVAIAASGLAIIIGLVIVFGSPYIAIRQMRSAIAERDADALSDYVDFPVLRENLKGQVMGGMMQSMDTPEMKSNPFAGIGQALGAAMLGPMIDSMVSPAGIIALMRRASPKIDRDSEASTSSENSGYALSFKGWDRVVLHRTDTDSLDGALTLRRYGLWNWKLTSIEMPADVFKR